MRACILETDKGQLIPTTLAWRKDEAEGHAVDWLDKRNFWFKYKPWMRGSFSDAERHGYKLVRVKVVKEKQ